MARRTVRDAHQDFAKTNSCHAHLAVRTIFVLVTKQGNKDDIFHCEDYTSHPIISKSKPDGSRVYIDEDGNVYNDWEYYKNENKLDYGIMIAPRNGHYSFDEDGNVHLEILEKTANKSSQSSTVREAQQKFATNCISDDPNCKSNIIHVLLTNEIDIKNAENAQNFTLHPIIRSKGPEGTDYKFIDEDGNTYNDWNCYKIENKLNCGIMVAPLNGYYSFDENGKVKLEACETPAAGTDSSIIASKPPTIAEAYFNYAKFGGSTIYVLVTTEYTIDDVLDSREYTIHSLVQEEDMQKNRYFVDNNGKKYASWNIYTKENELPEGVMVAPFDGSYSKNSKGQFQVQILLTPAFLRNKGNQTIGTYQQKFAIENKYKKSDEMTLHVCVVSNECENILELRQFKDFCIQRKRYEGHRFSTDFIYEDECGKTYLNWKSYLQENNLPDGIMISPRNGVYTFDSNGDVELDILLTPERRKKPRTVVEVQQDLANNSGYKKEIIWDLLSSTQFKILKDKIESLIPDQEKGQRKIEEMRQIIFEKVWAQRKYTNGNSVSAIIYVFVTNCETQRSAKMATRYSCHPVFRTRKCTADSDSSHCCMVFIDEQGRIYKNWKSYLDGNDLPAGLMVAPHNGIYTTNECGEVQLDYYITPNGSPGRQALGVVDKATAVAGFGAATVPVAAMMMTVAPPIVLGAAAIGVTTAVYSTVRSFFNLVDRKQHGQSISFDDPQARSSWIGVGAGVVGFGASRATKVITKAATAGKEISVMTELVVNGMNISSIVLSGTGVANGILDLMIRYRDDEDWTALEVAQLAASLVLFTHSVSNFRLASTLINETHTSRIQDYRKSLSNRQRKMFDKMSKETIRIRGATHGKVDIIRSVNDIPSKQYLNDLYKVNKELNKAKVRPSFAAGGKGIVLNNEVKVDTKVLRNNIQHNQGANILKSVTQPIPGSHSNSNANANAIVNPPNASRLVLSNNKLPQSKLTAGAIGMSSIILPNTDLIKLANYGTRLFEIISNFDSFSDVITTLADVYCPQMFDFLMKLAQQFVEKELDKLRAIIQIFIPSESILYRILKFCQEKYRNYPFEYIRSRKEEILKNIKNYFESLSPNSNRFRRKCEDCGGYFSISPL